MPSSRYHSQRPAHGDPNSEVPAKIVEAVTYLTIKGTQNHLSHI
jgi:hypothetical protein